MILTDEDFENKKDLTYIPVEPDGEQFLNDVIQWVENTYLPKLFGVELYNLFIADLALPTVGAPTATRFANVFNPFLEQPENDIIQSMGIKSMLKGFTYYHYVRDVPTELTTTGLKKIESDNSTNVSAIGHDVTRRYNEAIEAFQAIQCYMVEIDEANYTEFKGVFLKYNHPF